MGYTVSFLNFTPRDPLPVSWRGINLQLTLLTLGVVLIARLWPAALAARKSVIDQEQERVIGHPECVVVRHVGDIVGAGCDDAESVGTSDGAP